MTATLANPSLAPTKPARMLSIDALRGLTLAFMILVNNNGDWVRAYWPLKHAEWNGFTPTDLVFPTFLFLIGVSIVFSTQSRLAQGATRQSLFLHILWRTAILLLLGFFCNSFPYFHFATMRFYGVLPRIAICYGIVATLYLISPGWRGKLAILVACLVSYWLLMRFVTVPGYGLPTRDIPINDPNGNLTAFIDRHIFPPYRLYETTRDPEGLLSTIPALATPLLGVLTGIWLRTGKSLAQKARGIAIAGLSCVLLGGLWNIEFPINKKLWTSPFVLFAGGCSLLLLALSIFVVDILGGRDTIANSLQSKINLGKSKPKPWLVPLLVFGTNAITAYVISELLPGILGFIHVKPRVEISQWYWDSLVKTIHDLSFASLVFSLTWVLICWIPVAILYRRRIFIKI